MKKLMKKLGYFIFCMMLFCRATAGLFPVFLHETETQVQVQEECPCDDIRKAD